MAETDERAVSLITSSITSAEAALRIALREEKLAIRDAAHAAWHSKQVGSGGAQWGVIGGNGKTQTQIELIHAACSRVELTKQMVIKIEEQISKAQASSASFYSLYKE